jgi:hypothetical protein
MAVAAARADARQGLSGWRSAAVAAAAIVLLTGGYTAWLLPARGAGLPGWLLPLTIAASVIAVMLLLLGPAVTRADGVAMPMAALAVALTAMLLVPATASVSVAVESLGPFDTPFESQAVDRSTRAFLDTIEPAQILVPTLENAQFGAPYLMATQTSALAAPFIYVSGREVLPIGGYTGAIPAPTLAQLQSMIRDAKFHLVLQTRTASDPRLVWITKNCRFVPNSAKEQYVAYFCGSVAQPSEGQKAATTSPPQSSRASTSLGSISQTDLLTAAIRVQQIVTTYPAFRLPAATLQALKANPTDPVALAEAHRVLGPNYLNELIALTTVPPSTLLYLEKWGPIVSQAVADGQLPKPQTGR